MNDKTSEIRIDELLHAVIKHRFLILLLTLAGLILGIGLSVISYMRGEMSRGYVIKSSFAVTSVNEDGLFTSMTNDPNQEDIHLAEDMVDAVMYVIKSDTTLNAAIREMSMVGVSVDDLRRNIQLKQYNETQIIEVTLYWRTSDEGVKILNALNKVIPNILVSTLKIGDVSVVNEPKAEYSLGGKMNIRIWIYAMVLGMAAGIGYAVLKFLLSPTLTTIKDLPVRYNMDVLGEIPENKEYFSGKGSILDEDRASTGAAILDEYASSAHFLLHKLGNEEHHCIYITSSGTDEGKTSVAAHLAVEMSDLGKRVLLVDLDVRKPALGTIFLDTIEYNHSLNALYRGDSSLQDTLIHLNGNLDLLPVILEKRPLPLSNAVTGLISSLTDQYDLVLIDSAPIGKVSDPMNLNEITKDVLFVVRYDYASMKVIQDSLERLEKSGANIMGCVVNRVQKFGGLF